MADRLSCRDFFAQVKPEEAFQYQEYWESLIPRNNAERFKRCVFALCSIRATWQQNVAGYQALTKDLSWVFDRSLLETTIAGSKLGLEKSRTRALWELATAFWVDDTLFHKRNEESWAEFRNRLTARLFGLGLAKTSFSIEMMYPVESEVVCLDSHMLRGLGSSTKTPTALEYSFYERLWLDGCERAGIPPPIARHMYWDKLHGQPNTRYWSHCLEGNN